MSEQSKSSHDRRPQHWPFFTQAEWEAAKAHSQPICFKTRTESERFAALESALQAWRMEE